MRTVVLTGLQLVGLGVCLVGVYLLCGLAWALVLGGLALGGVAVLAEIPTPGPRRARRRPAREGPVTEIPGARRSRPRED